MTKVDIAKDEIQALDIVLGKVEVKPIVGYKLANLRIKIQNAILAEEAKNGEKATGKIDESNKKRS